MTYIPLLATVAMSACASRPSDWRPFGLRLQQGMSESQVIAAIGYAPDRAEVVTCDAERGGAWECRRLSFDSPGFEQHHPLIVYEANQGGVWRVDSWNTL